MIIYTDPLPLQTTLRQEGIVLPGKQLPVQRQSEERVAKDNDANTQDSPTMIQSPQVTETIHELASLRDNILETTDFRTVLKDLQMLSASLLEMDNEETV